MAIPRVQVAAPTLRPTKFGLFSAADVKNANDGHWQAGSEWESDACIADLNYSDALCETSDPKFVSEFGGSFESTPFVVYALRECRGPGDINAARDRANAILVNSEERAVEAEVWARFAADADAVNITPATAPTVEVGIAMLEAWMGDHYAGAPTIHAQRDVASYLATKAGVDRHGNHLETVLGSYVSAGNGYGTAGVAGAEPAAGTRWIWASSTVQITKGVAMLKGPLFVQHPHDNTQVVLAERVYSSGYECAPVGIRVTFP